MITRFPRISTALATAAALSMVASPAMARGWSGSGGWGAGWGSGWGGHHRHHRHKDGIDGGDVLAGVLILGGIAAIASAASKADKQRRENDYRYPDPADRDQSRGYDEPGRDGAYAGSQAGPGGVGAAVDTCADEVERADRRIVSIDSVVREGEGWRVEGLVGGDRDFACSVSDTGRIRSVTVDGRAA